MAEVERPDGAQPKIERVLTRRSLERQQKVVQRLQTAAILSKAKGEKMCPWLAEVIQSDIFDTAMGILILANAATMGVQAEILLGHSQDYQTTMTVFENVFTFLFVMELGAKVFLFGIRRYVPFIGNTWLFLDALLVIVTGVLMVWVFPLIDVANSPAMQSLAVLRAVRLMRLVNVVARVPVFHEAWQMLRGLAESMRTLFWTILVIFCITYIFAVFGVIIITQNLQDRYREVEGTGSDSEEELAWLLSVTDGIFSFMYTLIQVLTLDSWTGISRSMSNYILWSVTFFYCYIAVVVFVLLNLVTAVIVNSALENSQKDRDQLLVEKLEKDAEELARVQALFQMLDSDNNNEVTLQEFELAFEKPEIATTLKLLGFEPDECRDLFLLLDTGDGSLSLHEFFQGLQRMQGEAAAQDVFRVMKTVKDVEKMVVCYAQEVEEDLNTVLRATPGVGTLELRESDLKKRSGARRRGISTENFSEDGKTCPVVYIPGSEGARSDLSSSVDAESRATNAFQPVGMGAAILAAGTLAEQVQSCRQVFRDRLARCDERVGALGQEVSELRRAVLELLKRLDQFQDLQQQPESNAAYSYSPCMVASGWKRGKALRRGMRSPRVSPLNPGISSNPTHDG